MMRRAQASLEYLFILAVALVLVAVFLKKFFDPRSGTVKRMGHFESDLEENVTSVLNDMGNLSTSS